VDCSGLFRGLHIKEDTVFQMQGGQHGHIMHGQNFSFPKDWSQPFLAACHLRTGFAAAHPEEKVKKALLLKPVGSLMSVSSVIFADKRFLRTYPV
jgi:hypothetical protein